MSLNGTGVVAPSIDTKEASACRTAFSLFLIAAYLAYCLILVSSRTRCLAVSCFGCY